MSECKIPTGSTDCISRQAVIDLMMQKWGENFSGDDAMQESIDAIRVMPSVTPEELIHGKCNQCKYYEGVHNVQGHAPCSYHKIGGVMWNWYCSQFESEG